MTPVLCLVYIRGCGEFALVCVDLGRGWGGIATWQIESQNAFLCEDERAFGGVWGAYINTDGFTVGEQAETYYGLRIFDLFGEGSTIQARVV